jgi:nucleotide-binding universal stress UspA family protein
MSYKRILVPLDGSKLSERALEQVVEIAAPDAEVHILSVVAANLVDEVASLSSAKSYSVPSSETQWPQVKDTDPHDPSARETYLDRVSEWLQGAGYQVIAEAVSGNVLDTILATARRGVDVIVLATHGRRGASKVILGSVTEALLLDAPCPVLVVPASAAKGH